MKAIEKEAIQEYLNHANALFDSLKSCFHASKCEKLAFAFELSDSYFQELKAGVDALLIKTLKLNGVEANETDLYQQLYEHLDSIVNITANGAVLPNNEIQSEFNIIQKMIVDLFQSYGGDQVFEYGQCPINIRISETNRLNKLKGHPFASLKFHTDMWAGEPLDHTNFLIPIFTDASYMNLEIREPTEATEFNAVIKAVDYDSALPTVEMSDPYDLHLAPGMVGVLESRAIHRTLFKPLNTLRVSLDFRFRFKLPVDLRFMLDSAFPEEHVHYVPYDLWKEIGRSKTYLIEESFRDYVERSKVQASGSMNHRYNRDYRSRFADSV